MLEYLKLAAACLLGVVFAVSAVGKLRGRRALDEFVNSLRPLGLLPGAAIRPVGYGVTAVEVVIPPLLAAPFIAPTATAVRPVGTAGFALAVALLTMLTIGIAVAVRRGRRVPCRCFGKSSTPLGVAHIVRNILLIGVAAAGLAGSLAGPAGSIEPGLAVTVAAAGLLSGLLVTAFDDIVELFRPLSRFQPDVAGRDR